MVEQINKIVTPEEGEALADTSISIDCGVTAVKSAAEVWERRPEPLPVNPDDDVVIDTIGVSLAI